MLPLCGTRMGFVYLNLQNLIFGFFLVILQVPYKYRYKVENLLLVSLWFGDEKPVPNLFLEPIKQSLKNLYKGVEIYVKDLNNQ